MRLYGKRYKYTIDNLLKYTAVKDYYFERDHSGQYSKYSIYQYGSYGISIVKSSNFMMCFQRLNPVQIKIMIYKIRNIDEIDEKLANYNIHGFYMVDRTKFGELVCKSKPISIGTFTIHSGRIAGKGVRSMKEFYLLNKSYYFKEGR